MKEHYFTFGQRYRIEPHPKYRKAHPDGYVTIVAADYEAARIKAFDLFDGHFAFQYSEPPTFCPLGEIERFEVPAKEINETVK